ncbi:MAG TPA: DHH family phosphoesterase [Candidatus Avamphibacillus intestinigallinarum]|nr:DHH family phosphoesterase [Candidatus Avamphibacillus intestinigallinarum]
MQDVNKKPTLRSHFWVLYGISLVLLAFVWMHNWKYGLVLTFFVAASFYYSIQREQSLHNERSRYIATLSHRIKKVGEEALLEMPIGIVLYDEDYKIEWTNTYMNQFSDLAEEEVLIGTHIDILSEDLIGRIKEGYTETWLDLKDCVYEVTIRKEERLLYLFDRTNEVQVEQLYHDEQTILSIFFLDNYEEITQTMDDTLKSQLNSQVTQVLNEWAQKYGLFLKRTSQERFLAVGTKKILREMEEDHFDILNTVRELNTEHGNPLTLSIGVGGGVDLKLPDLGALAQSSLDLALGRGGDQVAIKDEAGKVRFYGGKTNPMEKRTRVRARVISHALKGLIEASENVIIMGHKSPDMDSVGAAIGVLNIARRNNVEGYIVLDEHDVHSGVVRLIDAIRDDEDLWSYFVSPDDAEAIVTENTLIVVVDTHRPKMVADEKLLNKTDYKVVIDHHRRGEDFIENPTLVYMEPYASSTAELVTELLEYQPQRQRLTMLEASALLAGIIVDTKSFTLRTGSRTFDAASYLRSKGADTVLVQRFMKEDLNLYVRRSKLIERAKVYRNTVAIATGDPDEVYDQVLIAQAADTLLTMNGMNASFVISKRSDDRVGISARSLGEVNVQIIMEQMNGGGHLTNAATQIEDTTVEDAEVLLKEILDAYFEGRDPS